MLVAHAVHGAEDQGGAQIWPLVDAQAGDQVALAMAGDGAGDVVLVGYTQTASKDFHVIKLHGDGSGVAWRVQRGGSGDDRAVAVAVDTAGDLVVAGNAWNGSSYDFDTIKLRGSDGQLLWARTLDGASGGHDYVTAVRLDGSGNVYVAGYSQGGGGADDFQLVKYAADGTFQWNTTLDGAAHGHDRIRSLDVAADCVVVAGESRQNAASFDRLTARYSTAGALVWEQHQPFAGDPSEIRVATNAACAVTSAGPVAGTTGATINTTRLNGTTGQLVWDVMLGSAYDQHPADLLVDASGNVVLAGQAFSTATSYDFYTFKLAAGTGQLLWSNTSNSTGDRQDIARRVVLAPNGNVLVTGESTDINTGLSDVRTVKLATDTGDVLWEALLTGPAGGNDRAVGLVVAGADSVVMGGWTVAGLNDGDFLAAKYHLGALNRPTRLDANVQSATSVQLNWSDNADNEDGFLLERKAVAADPFVEIASLAADVTTYLDTGLAPDTTFTYRVRARRNPDLTSPYSAEAHAITASVPLGPPAAAFVHVGAGAGDDMVLALSTGADNHPVAVGTSYSSIGQFDYLVAKVDRANGSVLMLKEQDGDQSGTDVAVAVVVDATNEPVVTGYSEMFTLGVGNTLDAYTLKYRAADFDTAWADQYQSVLGRDEHAVALALSPAASGGYAVTGYARNSAGHDDVILVSLAANGTRRWAAAPFGGTGDDHPAAVAIDPAGDVVVAGSTYTGTATDAWVAKYQGTTGVLLWSDTYGTAGDDDTATGVTVDEHGMIYASCVTTSQAARSACLLKYDGAGVQQWVRTRTCGATGLDAAVGLAVDGNDHDVLVAGTMLTGTGNGDYYVTRYDADGNVKWDRTVARPSTDEHAAAMGVDSAGNVVVAGETAAGSKTDLLVMQLDVDGNIIQGITYNGPAGGYDYATSLAVNRLGETFAGGYTIGAAADYDAVVVKMPSRRVQVPRPATAVPGYTTVALTWTDNSLDEEGHRVERKAGTCTSTQPWVPVLTAAPNLTQFNDALLIPGSPYCYRIEAYDSAGRRTPWLEVATTTLNPTPGDLTATAVNSNQVDLSWTDLTTGEEGFRVERCEGDGCGAFSVVSTVAANAVSDRDMAVCPDQTYSYRVVVFKTGDWTSGPSNTATVRTAGTAAPDTLVATRLSEAGIRLTWADRTSAESGFSVQRCSGASCTVFTDLVTVAANTTTYNDAAVIPDTVYRYQVAAVRTAGCTWQTGYSAIASATPTLVAPSGLTATVVGSNRVDLRWVDNTASETGFPVERCTDAGCSAFAVVATVGANAIYYPDTSVCSGTTYRYRLKASRTAAPVWESGYTNVTADTTTPAALAPSALVGTTLSESQIRLDWADNTTGETGFKVEQCLGAGCVDFLEVGSVGADIRTFTNALLTPGTTYAFRVRAYNTASCSWSTAYSNVVETATAAPPPPDNVTATGANTTEALVAWRDNTGSETAFTLERCTGVGCDFTTVVTLAAAANATNTRDTSACTATPYRYRVRAEKSTVPTWTTTWGGPADVVTPAAQAPATLTATRLNEAQVTLSWTDGNADETGFRIERCEGAGCVTFAEVGTAAAGVGTWVDSGLVLATEYSYRVRAYKTATCAWQGPYSPVATVNTGNPTAPASLAATAANTTRVNLTWTDLTGAETGFAVQRCTSAGCDFSGAVDNMSAVANAVGLQDDSACAGTSYTYRVRAERSGTPAWVTSWSNAASAQTAPAVEPGNVAAAVESDISVRITWQDNSLDESGFEVRRCQDAGCTPITVVASTGANVIEFLDTPLLPETTYRYEVRAFKAAACPWSVAGSVVTAVTAPNAPTGLTAAALNSSAVRLTWTDNSATEGGFELQRRIWNGRFITVAVLAAGATTFVDHVGLEPQKSYRYRVRATRGADSSFFSAEALVTTPAWSPLDHVCW